LALRKSLRVCNRQRHPIATITTRVVEAMVQEERRRAATVQTVRRTERLSTLVQASPPEVLADRSASWVCPHADAMNPFLSSDAIQSCRCCRRQPV